MAGRKRKSLSILSKICLRGEADTQDASAHIHALPRLSILSKICVTDADAIAGEIMLSILSKICRR